MKMLSKGYSTSRQCTPSWNQKAASSSGGVLTSKGLGNRFLPLLDMVSSCRVCEHGWEPGSDRLPDKFVELLRDGRPPFRLAGWKAPRLISPHVDPDGCEQSGEHAFYPGGAIDRPQVALALTPDCLGPALQDHEVVPRRQVAVNGPLDVLRRAVMALDLFAQPRQRHDLVVAQAQHGLPLGRHIANLDPPEFWIRLVLDRLG